MRSRAWWSSAIALAITGCSFASLDGLTGATASDGGGGGGGDASSDAAGTNDAPVADAGADAVVVPDAGACPGTGGPAGVNVGGFCIDATEVTNAQYRQFLGAPAVLPTNAGCSWKTSFFPAVWPPAPGLDDYPVVHVDWCDAYAFCAWAGKRLCGRVGGGPVAMNAAGNAQLDQFYAACSHNGDGQHIYPYGGAYAGGSCNVGGSAGAVPVGLTKTCAGGYPGVFDMVGNVWEWEDACSGTSGQTDTCNARTGSFRDPSAGATATCAYAYPTQRSFQDDDIGFRCCSNP